MQANHKPGGDTAEAKSSRDVLALGVWKGPWVRIGNFHRKRTAKSKQVTGPGTLSCWQKKKKHG